MDREDNQGAAGVWNRLQWMLLHLATLALLVVLALPASAADGRAVKSRVSPIYPEIAKRMHIAGEVRLEATVDADGKVKDVKAVSGNHMLALAAEDAVRKWRFEAGDGEATVEVAMNFELPK